MCYITACICRIFSSKNNVARPFVITLQGAIVAIFPLSTAQQLYCPGRSAISCATVSPVIWDGSAFNGQCPLNAISFQAVTTADIDKKSSCGVLNVTITNVLVRMDSGVETTEVISLLSIDAQPSLSGLTIVCRSANNRDVDIELLVPGGI